MKKTTPRKTVVPAIPEVAQTTESVHRALVAAKEAIEVGYGRRGDPMDRFATLRELRDAGIVDVYRGPGGEFSVARYGVPGTGAPIRDDGNQEPDYGDEDYTKPPFPKNVRAKGMPPDLDADYETSGIVMVTWDAPGYHNHHYAEIYRMDQNGTPNEPENPSDPNSPLVPVFNIDNELVDPNRPFGAILSGGAVNGFKPGRNNVSFAGTATGTIFVDNNLAPLDLPPSTPPPSDLDQALSPGKYYYWVRFVSRARVVSLISDRAGTSLSINPVLVLDAMTRNVTSTAIFSHLREWLDLGSDPAKAGGGILSYIDTAIDGSGIKSMWSVRMQHQTSNGLRYAAGFGLGMETDNETGESLSTFLVNANQFAIMGPNQGKPGSLILGLGLSGGSYQLKVLLKATILTHKFAVGDFVSISGPSGSVRVNDVTYPPSGQANPFPSLSGIEFKVLAMDNKSVPGLGNVSELTLASPDSLPSMPGWVNHVSGTQHKPEAVRAMNAVLMPTANIPFIVDTTRNVVGIRGKLIVDGLVRATQGEFNELTANTAFIKKLQAEVVNANLVIGQRIIAGAPGSGAIDAAAYSGISNYIVELNNPSYSQYPFRIWKPNGGPGHSIFDVSNQGDLYVGGNMTVNKSAVIRGSPEGGGGVIFSTGGGGSDTGQPGEPGSSNYAIWIGRESQYGFNGGGRSESNGIFWVKSDGRAGFQADVFLGGDPLNLPSGNGYITVKPKRTGGSARVYCSAGFSVIGSDLGNCQLGAALFIVPRGYSGPSAWPITRSPIGFESPIGNTPSDVSVFAGFFPAYPSIPGGRFIASTQVDSREKSRDVKSGTVQGSTEVPAGDYKVYLAFWVKGTPGGTVSHGCFAISPFAVQVSNDAAPGGYRPSGESLGPLGSFDEQLGDDWVVASEDILKGSFVNVYDEGGFSNIRKADASIPYRADGWIMHSAVEGDRVQVYRDGVNPYVEGLDVGEEYALGTAGGVVKLADATDVMVQPLGKALTETSMQVTMDEPVEMLQ